MRLDARWIVVGPVVAGLLQVERLEQLQRLQQARPLRPDAALADGVAAILDGDRVLDRRACVARSV